MTQLPGLIKAGEQAYKTWTAGQKAWTAARSWISGWTGTSATSDASSSNPTVVLEKEAIPDAPPVPEDIDHQAKDSEEKPSWGPTRCCISCVSHSTALPS
jgi:hypothetical protein